MADFAPRKVGLIKFSLLLQFGIASTKSGRLRDNKTHSPNLVKKGLEQLGTVMAASEAAGIAVCMYVY